MAAEMADLRHAVAEAEAERDEAGEEVGRLGAELDRLQQEWASDSAEFKVLARRSMSVYAEPRNHSWRSDNPHATGMKPRVAGRNAALLAQLILAPGNFACTSSVVLLR